MEHMLDFTKRVLISGLQELQRVVLAVVAWREVRPELDRPDDTEIGRASCRERVYVLV